MFPFYNHGDLKNTQENTPFRTKLLLIIIIRTQVRITCTTKFFEKDYVEEVY